MATVTKPLLTDETGQAIADAVEQLVVNTTVDDTVTSTSEHPVQSKAVYNYTKQVYISSTAPSSNQSNYLWVKPS